MGIKISQSHIKALLISVGKGTTTCEGTGIAYSVVQELLQHIKCHTLFMTHYNSLMEEFKNDINV